MTDKERMKKAFDHGKTVATFVLSNFPDSYAPLTFDSWYEQFTEQNPIEATKPAKKYPHCGSNKIIMFDSDNDICEKCNKYFPAIS